MLYLEVQGKRQTKYGVNLSLLVFAMVAKSKSYAWMPQEAGCRNIAGGTGHEPTLSWFRSSSPTATPTTRAKIKTQGSSGISRRHQQLLEQQQRRTASLYMGYGDGDDEKDDDADDAADDDDDDKKNYMAVVRSLQNSFYKTASSTPPCFFDWEQQQSTTVGGTFEKNNQTTSSSTTSPHQQQRIPTGQVRNLPILTWPWHEVPGRANVLHVHEGVYTHLMETVLRSNPPVWYVGHVYRAGKQTERKLKSWHQVAVGDTNTNDERNDDAKNSRSITNNNAVLGTLMRVTDYRRIADGRLLVLVQGLERFVVEEVVQSAPYSVAHVQLLPDVASLSEVDLSTRSNGSRLHDILESFQRWHRYEFEQTLLPLRHQSNKSKNDKSEYLDISEIIGSALTQVVPYAHFSPVVNVERLKEERLSKLTAVAEADNNDTNNHNLELELVEREVLYNPWLEVDLRSQSCNELEWELWVWIDTYLKQSKRSVSTALLGLLPPDETWPPSFVLERIVQSLVQEQTKGIMRDVSDHRDLVRVSSHYPALRRQTRLSYAAASLLEENYDSYAQTQSLRLMLLQIPSTQERLAYILQCFRERAGSFQ